MMMIELTASIVGPTWEVKFCFRGPPVLNSSLGVICQKPIGGSNDIHPWTLLYWSSQEYWYLSSTLTNIISDVQIQNAVRYLPWITSMYHLYLCQAILPPLWDQDLLGPQGAQPQGMLMAGLGEAIGHRALAWFSACRQPMPCNETCNA